MSNLGAPIVPLASICEQFFGLSPRAAQEHAALNKLPVPAFRLRESQKAPLMVHVRDLAKHIDDSHTVATEHWEHSQP